MIDTIQKLIALLTTKERRNAQYLIVIAAVVALVDVLGVASILPFMSVMLDPEILQSNSVLQWIRTSSVEFGVQSHNAFLILLGMFVLSLLFISLFLKSIATYFQISFIQNMEHSISKRLIEGYLRQPYSWLSDRNSSDLGRNILSEVQLVVLNGLMPLSRIFSQGFVVISLSILLIAVDPMLSLVATTFVSIVYTAIFWLMNKYLVNLGEDRRLVNQERFQTVAEAFSAIIDLKIRGLEKKYVDRFSDAAKIYAKSLKIAGSITQLPRYLLEAFSFGGILLILLYLLLKEGTYSKAIPTVALYAFAGYRLVPALQQIYGAFAQLRFVGSTVNVLSEQFFSFEQCQRIQNTVDNAATTNYYSPPFQISDSIVLQDVEYRYSGAQRNALCDVSFSISANQVVGIVGATGSGKSTLVDLLLGLLEPHAGSIYVDGERISKDNVQRLQSIVGYVPQSIYLCDKTIYENIAFGEDLCDINKRRVEDAARTAELHDFIVEELPQGYQTVVGERGARLSGGQCQRIGIARALYNNPKLLVLDEATSALDNLTESKIMQSLHEMRSDMTIVSIAHRLSTLKRCQKIVFLEEGRVLGIGTFNELHDKIEKLQKMVSAGR